MKGSRRFPRNLSVPSLFVGQEDSLKFHHDRLFPECSWQHRTLSQQEPSRPKPEGRGLYAANYRRVRNPWPVPVAPPVNTVFFSGAALCVLRFSSESRRVVGLPAPRLA